MSNDDTLKRVSEKISIRTGTFYRLWEFTLRTKARIRPLNKMKVAAPITTIRITINKTMIATPPKTSG
jgi:hypothetical protein